MAYPGGTILIESAIRSHGLECTASIRRPARIPDRRRGVRTRTGPGSGWRWHLGACVPACAPLSLRGHARPADEVVGTGLSGLWIQLSVPRFETPHSSVCLVEEEGQRIDMEIKTSSPEIDLKDYETTIVLRQMTMDDFDALIEMQAACFPGMEVWDREHIESQLKMFPEGQFCIEIDGKLAGSASGLIVDFSSYTEWHNWREISDDGYIRNHHPDGDTFYGIEMMVHPEFRGMKLSRRLYEKRKQVCREHNLNRIMIAGRIPGYGAVADEMTAREYVEEVMERSRLDPVLTPQLANGFVLKQLIPSYLDEDTASRGYATFLEWTNLDYVPESAATRTTKVELVRICSVQLNMKKIENFEEFAEQVEFFVDVA